MSRFEGSGVVVQTDEEGLLKVGGVGGAFLERQRAVLFAGDGGIDSVTVKVVLDGQGETQVDILLGDAAVNGAGLPAAVARIENDGGVRASRQERRGGDAKDEENSRERQEAVPQVFQAPKASERRKRKKLGFHGFGT